MQVTHEFLGAGIAFRFDHKPAEPIRQALKASGFRWSPSAGHWWRSRSGHWADLLAWIRDNLDGPAKRKPVGNCWNCSSPDGYFRNHGAASPVLCDRCEHAQAVGVDRFDMQYEDNCRDACGL